MISYNVFDDFNGDKSQLVDLWTISFGEEKAAVNLFFNNMFEKAVCFTACDGQKITASLYLLECGITGKVYNLSGYYLYAASTLPSYRNRGIMRNLINTAVDFAKKNDKDFISLLPAKGTLYEFYKTNGFSECFGTADCSVSLNKLKKYIPNEMKSDFASCDFVDFYDMREQHFSKFPHIEFDKAHIKYSTLYNTFYGARFIYSNDGYAIYFEIENNLKDCKNTEAFVTELVCPSEKLGEYLAFIADTTQCKKLTVRLDFNTAYENKFLLADSIEKNRFAMIKPLNSSVDFDILRKNIYFGLTLE